MPETILTSSWKSAGRATAFGQADGMRLLAIFIALTAIGLAQPAIEAVETGNRVDLQFRPRLCRLGQP